MITVGLEDANLNDCIEDAQQERVLITRQGKPVALIIGIEGLDAEQVQLGSSSKFWTLMNERREQQTMSRAQLEQSLATREQQR